MLVDLFALETRKLVKDKLTEVQERIDALDERFAIGVINSDLYHKFIGKYAEERENIQKELAKTAMESSNLDKSIEKLLEMCDNPLLAWENSTIDGKMRIQNQFFPDGITVDSQKREV